MSPAHTCHDCVIYSVTCTHIHVICYCVMHISAEFSVGLIQQQKTISLLLLQEGQYQKIKDSVECKHLNTHVIATYPLTTCYTASTLKLHRVFPDEKAMMKYKFFHDFSLLFAYGHPRILTHFNILHNLKVWIYYHLSRCVK